MKKNENVWDKWRHEDLAKQVRSHRDGRKRYLDLIKKYLGKSNEFRILEAGCGSAIDSYIIAEECEVEVFGVDISREALTVASRIGEHFNKKVNLSLGDVRSLEFADSSFDMVFSQGLIEHFDMPVHVLKEQVRVLKPGGVLIVNVPQKYSAYTVHKHLMAMFGRWEWGNEKEFSSRQLSTYGARLGLEFLEKAGYGYWFSPFEIAYVLRTLNRKMAKIPFIKKYREYEKISCSWDRMWERLEDNYGHLFMKNIIYVYRKPFGLSEDE